MSKKTDIDELVMLSHDAFEGRMQAAAARVETRIQRAYDENRDLTQREKDLTYQDRDELVALKDADEIRAAREREAQRIENEVAARSQHIGAAMEIHERSARLSPLAVSDDNLAALETARREYRSLSVIEHRSALTTSLMGTAVEYSAGGLPAAQTLWRAAGIPTVEPPAGYKGTVPKITLPVGAALVTEGNAHAEFDDVEPDTVTMGRAGAWSDLTAEGNISSPLADISTAHGRIIARNLDLAVVTKLEGTPSALTIDEALTTVAAEAAVDVSALWIVGTPVDIAGLAGNATFAATNAGDVGSYATTYGGARLYVTPTASTGELTVFWPGGFKAFATRLASGVVVDPTTGAQRFGQWMMFGIGQSLTGAAVTVAEGS